jgi:hypothetical protein
MRYTKPAVLQTVGAASGIKSISSNKANPQVMDNPNDLSSFGSTAGYEADE